MLNTLKTTMGFITSVLKKQTSLRPSGLALEDTCNYLKINERIATSGQPTGAQFHLMQTAGYQTVINLAPDSVLENSLTTETALLHELDIQYIHIPVDFTKPTEQDFIDFTASMQASSEQKVWVHCAANMRVSAFIYRYRCNVLGENEPYARNDLEKIWQPFGVWKKFIDAHPDG